MRTVQCDCTIQESFLRLLHDSGLVFIDSNKHEKVVLLHSRLSAGQIALNAAKWWLCVPSCKCVQYFLICDVKKIKADPPATSKLIC